MEVFFYFSKIKKNVIFEAKLLPMYFARSAMRPFSLLNSAMHFRCSAINHFVPELKTWVKWSFGGLMYVQPIGSFALSNTCCTCVFCIHLIKAQLSI
jgi:hypothetical protein